MLPKKQFKMTAALMLVLIMLAVPVFSQLSTDANDTDATDVNAETYYYDQLSNAGKAIYNAIADDKTAGTYNVSITTSNMQTDMNQAIAALNTEKVVELDWTDLSIGYSYTGSQTCTITSYTITAADGYTESSQKVSLIQSSIDNYVPKDNSTRYTTVKSIHDYLAELLTYDSDISGTYIRTIYGSLLYDHSVVCEGYARTFKGLCDANDVPCIIIRGYAGTSTMESHMYNYVQMEDGKWYLVDVTWDDQSGGIQYNYMLAGTSSEGFNNTTIAYSHDATITESTGFTVPTLSTTGYTFESTISFDTTGGSVISSITQDYGTSVAKPTDPTRTGYTFSGWYYEGTVYTFSTMPANSIELTAQWTINQYTIHFDSNGGSTVASITQNYGTSIAEPTEPTRSGYTFTGWYTDENCTQDWNSATPITGNMTVYAGWDGSEESSGGFNMTYIIVGIIALLVVIAVIAMIVKKGKGKV
jgi:uncharacterized repeat protein (TIGR02543 family)